MTSLFRKDRKCRLPTTPAHATISVRSYDYLDQSGVNMYVSLHI